MSGLHTLEEEWLNPFRRSFRRSVVPTFAVALACWSVFLVMARIYLQITREKAPYDLRDLPFDITVIFLGAGISTALTPLIRSLAERSIWVQIAGAVLLITPTVLLFEPFFRTVIWLLFTDIRDWGPIDAPWTHFAAAGVFWSSPFGIWVAGCLLVLHERQARASERRVAAANALAQEAQLRALRYQINPHFLHNTLNAIAALILDRRNVEAEQMVIRLGDFFRSSLAQDPLLDATVQDEVALQRAYLEIEEQRFVGRLHLETRVPPDLGQARVPGFILQPLVENALKHGLPREGRPMRLTISAERSGETLLVEVADDGRGSAAADAGAEGIGLRNVADRLAARFGDAARLTTRASPSGFRARIQVPLCFS